MTMIKTYPHLEVRPDKSSKELFIRGTGVRSSTIWHDRYTGCRTPAEIAEDRDIPIEAIYDALAFCLDNWELIRKEKDEERAYLEERGVFEKRSL